MSAKLGDIWHRFEAFREEDRDMELYHVTLVVVRITPTGVRLVQSIAPLPTSDKVNTSWYVESFEQGRYAGETKFTTLPERDRRGYLLRRYAYPTEAEALESLEIRLRRRDAHLRRDMEDNTEALELVKTRRKSECVPPANAPHARKP